jgi:Tfp pilus assembly protein PilN
MTARINLAPEVYQQSQRNKELRKVATSASVFVGAIAVGVVVVLLVLIGGQKVLLATIQSSINSDEAKLKTFSDLQDAATIQQHLDSLSSLQQQRLYLTKFFKTLQNTAPTDLQVTTLQVDSSNTLQADVRSRSYKTATKFAKALEASNVDIGPNASPSNSPYFTSVQLGEVGNDGQGAVEYKITATVSSEVTNGQ